MRTEPEDYAYDCLDDDVALLGRAGYTLGVVVSRVAIVSI